MNITTLVAGSLLLALPCISQNLGIKLTHGVNGYVEVAPAAPLTPRSGITVEAWITYDESTLQAGWAWPTLVRKNVAAGGEDYFLRVDAGQTSITQLRFKVVTTANLELSAAWTFSPGQLRTWTHVAGTYDGVNARLFVNGVQMAISTTGSGVIRNSGGVLRIGKGDDAGGAIEVWNGEIDEVRLWPFARSAAEILSTMNTQLAGVPGKASTWSLNNHLLDTSNGLHGTLNGTVTYNANTLNLTNSGAGAVAFGSSTASCNGPVDSSVGSPARVANPAFAVVCTNARPSTSGLMLLSVGALSNPIQFLGVGIWVNVATPMIVLPASTGVLGDGRVALPVPNDPSLANQSLSTQFFWADACGTQGLTASDGLTITFLP